MMKEVFSVRLVRSANRQPNRSQPSYEHYMSSSRAAGAVHLSAPLRFLKYWSARVRIRYFFDNRENTSYYY